MLLEILRELLWVVAATGVAAAAWLWVLGRADRDRALADAQSRSDAHALDLKASIAGLDARIDTLGTSLAAIASRGQGEEQRWAVRTAIHALLQATRDPFLSFEEIETALSQGERQTAGDALRRVLMEMVADRVIAQLDRDRYFIASDFETGDFEAGDFEAGDGTNEAAS